MLVTEHTAIFARHVLGDFHLHLISSLHQPRETVTVPVLEVKEGGPACEHWHSAPVCCVVAHPRLWSY